MLGFHRFLLPVIKPGAAAREAVTLSLLCATASVYLHDIAVIALFAANTFILRKLIMTSEFVHLNMLVQQSS